MVEVADVTFPIKKGHVALEFSKIEGCTILFLLKKNSISKVSSSIHILKMKLWIIFIEWVNQLHI